MLSYALIISSSAKHVKIKEDLSDDYTKGTDNYPQTRSQALMMMDHYSKSPAAVAISEGTAFAQSGKKKKDDKNKAKSDGKDKDPKDFDKDYWKDKECYRCGKKGHPASACSVKPPKDDNDDSKSASKSGSKINMDVLRKLRATGKALT